jgi:hypothetical protein
MRRDRTIVGDVENQTFLTVQQAHRRSFSISKIRKDK